MINACFWCESLHISTFFCKIHFPAGFHCSQKHILVQYIPDISQYMYAFIWLSFPLKSGGCPVARPERRDVECPLWFLNPWKKKIPPFVLCYLSKIIAVLMRFPSLAALDVVIMTASSAADDGSFVGMTTFPYNSRNSRVICDRDISGVYSVITMSIKSD